MLSIVSNSLNINVQISNDCIEAAKHDPHSRDTADATAPIYKVSKNTGRDMYAPASR